MKPINGQYHYFKVKKLNHNEGIEFAAMAEFIDFMQVQQLKAIFISYTDLQPHYFGIIHKGGLLVQHTAGFKTVEDYQTAMHNKFEDAATFYAAQEKGFTKLEDYELVKQIGIADKQEFEKIKATGFLDGFKNWESISASLPQLEKFENAYQLFQFATKNDFENYEQFSAAIQNGFMNLNEQKSATEKGFTNATDYKDAVNRGFYHAADYHLANEKKIRDYAELKKHGDLDAMVQKHLAFDQRILLITISRLPQNKKIPFYKLDELFQQALDSYRYADTKALPQWISIALHNKQETINFVAHHDEVKEYGQYDSEGEYFETKRLQDRKIVVDGSNVAHNSQGKDNSKPKVENMIKVVNELKRRGINDITVIADASLKHKLVDKEKINEFEKMVKYLIAPAEFAADIFIIQYVKSSNCLLLSNDTFREWKIQDPWVAENIDFYRLSFLIDGDKVLMPDLD